MKSEAATDIKEEKSDKKAEESGASGEKKERCIPSLHSIHSLCPGQLEGRWRRTLSRFAETFWSLKSKPLHVFEKCRQYFAHAGERFAGWFGDEGGYFKGGFAASAPQIKLHPKIPFICVSKTRS